MARPTYPNLGPVEPAAGVASAAGGCRLLLCCFCWRPLPPGAGSDGNKAVACGHGRAPLSITQCLTYAAAVDAPTQAGFPKCSESEDASGRSGVVGELSARDGAVKLSDNCVPPPASGCIPGCFACGGGQRCCPAFRRAHGPTGGAIMETGSIIQPIGLD